MTFTGAKYVVFAALGGMLCAASVSAHADWKPKQEIKIIVPAGPGGGSDQFVRQIAQAAEKVDPSVKIVVENISGGGGATGFTAYMGMQPDGYTYVSVYPEIGLKLADGTLPYGADNVQPVMRAQAGPATLLIKGDETRFKTYDEMIAFMKKSNVELVVATYTIRGFDDLTLDAIEKKEGVKFKRVPYVKAGERFAGLMGGHVDLLTQRIGDVMKFIEAGTMKPILVDVPERLEQFPDLPTFKDQKIPFELRYWRGIWASAKVPAEAVAFLDDLLHKAMSEPGYEKYTKAGFYHLVDGYLDHKAFTDYVKREIDIYKQAYSEKK
ncbi:MAG: Bug family tripartite tricarboxylate transporter substrate binding protein [Hyphomicrobiales bacterium]